MTTALGFKARVGGSTVPLLNLFFPVGSIYHSTKATDPSTFMGGTWRRLQDVFLYAAGSKSAGSTGGEESHTLTIAEMPTHNHDMQGFEKCVYDSNGAQVRSRGMIAGDPVDKDPMHLTGGGFPQQYAPVPRRVHVGAHFVVSSGGGLHG